MFSCSRYHFTSLDLTSLHVVNHDLHHLLSELNTYISICRKEIHSGERLALAGQLKNAAEDFIQATGDPKIFKSERFGIALSEAPQKFLRHFSPTQFYLNIGKTITRIVNNMAEALSLHLIQPNTQAFMLQERLHFAINSFLRIQREIQVEIPRQIQTFPALAPAPSVITFTPTFTAPPQHIFPYQQAVPQAVTQAVTQAVPLPQIVVPHPPTAPQPFQYVPTPDAPSPLPYNPVPTVAPNYGPRANSRPNPHKPDPEFEKLLSSFMTHDKSA